MDTKIGIVGMGDGGLSNLRGLQNVAHVVAMCDPDASKDEHIRNESNVSICRDLSSMLEAYPTIDVVIIATPDNDHLAPTQQALEQGARVFVEKPLATTREDLAAFGALNQKHPGKILFSEKYSFATPINALLEHSKHLGAFMWGSTSYTMSNCNRIMGGGKWRTEHAYNPCSGGLSHNFMTTLLFSGSPIVRVRATGRVLTYTDLNAYGGYDTMEGTLEFANGRRLSWNVCLAATKDVSPFGHRTVTHTLQFENGSLAYGPNENQVRLADMTRSVAEPEAQYWRHYNIEMYRRMHMDLLTSIRDTRAPRHTAEHGLNVAWACLLAFESAKLEGHWLKLPSP